MNQGAAQLNSREQPQASNDRSHDAEMWDRLTDDDRRLIWLTASGKNVAEIAADRLENPREVAQRYRTLLDKLGLADRLSLVLAAAAYTAQEPVMRRRV